MRADEEKIIATKMVHKGTKPAYKVEVGFYGRWVTA